MISLKVDIKSTTNGHMHTRIQGIAPDPQDEKEIRYATLLYNGIDQLIEQLNVHISGQNISFDAGAFPELWKGVDGSLGHD